MNTDLSVGLLVYFFNKSFICVRVLWWFMIYCSWSSYYAFEYRYLLFWIVFWSPCSFIAVKRLDRAAGKYFSDAYFRMPC
jgi:phospholipid-translocating ATPase